MAMLSGVFYVGNTQKRFAVPYVWEKRRKAENKGRVNKEMYALQ